MITITRVTDTAASCPVCGATVEKWTRHSREQLTDVSRVESHLQCPADTTHELGCARDERTG